jgi:polyisoprenoid-binding protein YceI
VSAAVGGDGATVLAASRRPWDTGASVGTPPPENAMKTLLLVPLLLAVPALAPSGSPAPSGPNDWQVDGVHSSVVFKVKHANASWFKGTFDVVTGTVTLDPAKPETGSVTLTIPVDSIDTNDKKRDEHLRHTDFFGSKENPEITFKSSKIAKNGAALAVTGELAMAGKKKEVTIPVEKVGEGDMMGKRVVGFSSTFTIKRSDFGMTYGVDKNMLGDEVTLMIDLELTPAK